MPPGAAVGAKVPPMFTVIRCSSVSSRFGGGLYNLGLSPHHWTEISRVCVCVCVCSGRGASKQQIEGDRILDKPSKQTRHPHMRHTEIVEYK